MSYLERLKPASFRDVRFYIESHETTLSRRIATHVYPGSERHYAEDLGRSPSGFTIEGYLLGDDYDRQRNLIIDAANKPGPADLIHPYLGRLKVHCSNLIVREIKNEGRYCSISLTFIEAGDNVFPSSTEIPTNSIEEAEGRTRNLLKNAFLKAYSITGLAREKIDDLNRSIRSNLRHMDESTRLSAQGFEELVDLAVSIGDLNATVSSALEAPERVAEVLESGIGIVRKSGAPLLQKVKILGDLVKSSDQQSGAEVLAADPNRPLKETLRLTKYLASAEMTLTLSGYIQAFKKKGTREVVSEEDWRSALKVNVLTIEQLGQESSNLKEYEALEDLRAKLFRLSESEDVFALPNLKRFKAPYRMPFLQAVFDIYGSIERAPEVLRRNKLDDVLIIQKDQELEYLDG